MEVGCAWGGGVGGGGGGGGVFFFFFFNDTATTEIYTLSLHDALPISEIGKKIYSFVRYGNKTYRGREAFEILSKNQLAGLKEASKRGMVVKVNSVLIPGINDKHLVEVAKVVRELGAYTMNVMPLIPQGNFKDIPPPTAEEVNRIRDGCEAVINQFRNCIQCRADAIGVPGEEGCSANILEKIEIIKTD